MKLILSPSPHNSYSVIELINCFLSEQVSRLTGFFKHMQSNSVFFPKVLPSQTDFHPTGCYKKRFLFQNTVKISEIWIEESGPAWCAKPHFRLTWGSLLWPLSNLSQQFSHMKIIRKGKWRTETYHFLITLNSSKLYSIKSSTNQQKPCQCKAFLPKCKF